jgi:hypothetical protein
VETLTALKMDLGSWCQRCAVLPVRAGSA